MKEDTARVRKHGTAKEIRPKTGERMEWRWCTEGGGMRKSVEEYRGGEDVHGLQAGWVPNRRRAKREWCRAGERQGEVSAAEIREDFLW